MLALVLGLRNHASAERGAGLHVYPPAPSSLRIGLSEAHDELCRRLIAKDPADRFQSADEVVGALRVLAPDTSRTSSRDVPGGSNPGARQFNMRIAIGAAAVLMLAAIGISAWM